jgi:hypothetical protein
MKDSFVLRRKTRVNRHFDVECFYTTVLFLDMKTTHEEMGMEEDNLQQLKGELEKAGEQLEEAQHVIRELRVSYALGALILAGLAAVMFQTFSFLIFGNIDGPSDVVLFMFSLLVGPAALFLFFLHCYELYGIAKKGEKSIPLTLDFMYFVYVAFAFVTMMSLNPFYQHHGISWQFLSAGWGLAVVVLSLEVVLSLLVAKFIVTLLVAPLLPHFFEQSEEHPLHRIFEKQYAKPTGIYYFRKKPDIHRWEDQDCFVKY